MRSFRSKTQRNVLRSSFWAVACFGIASTMHLQAAVPRGADEVSIVIELHESPVAVVYSKVVARGAGHTDAKSAAVAQLQRIRSDQACVLQSVTGSPIESRVLYTIQRVYNGVAVRVGSEQVARIRKLPGVKAVHPLILKHTTNATSVPFIGVPTVWDPSGLDLTGEGISVGVIDSGVDYLHTTFGGSGLASDYSLNDTTSIADGFFPSAKVVGGYDFVGDAYNASSLDPAHNTPMPDPDPMDCMGHGTHVAGTAAGLGMNADGTTYAGEYDSETDFEGLGIGPGVAPEADIYALRVFGCSGASAVVDLALEWAVDPDGDGDLADHLDVVNMSLASAYGGSDDPTSVAADNASLVGVIVVASSGNDRDSHFVTGSPASAERAVSVAASSDDGFSAFAVRVHTPEPIAGAYHAWSAGFGPFVSVPGVNAGLAVAEPVDACSPLSNPDAEVDGRVVLIERGECSPVTQARHAQNAGSIGAVGAVIFNNRLGGLVFLADDGSGDDITIPTFSIRRRAGQQMAAAVAGESIVEVDMTVVPLGDVATWFSSRGPRRADPEIILKPDIAAPGVVITSAWIGNNVSGGMGSIAMSGTSMSSPMVSGVMALLRQLHPSRSVADLKAVLMNTASRLYLDPENTSPLTSPPFMGSGRVNPQGAVTADVIAYDAAKPQNVSMSFGSLEVSDSIFITRELVLRNMGASTVEFGWSMVMASDVPGVDIFVPTDGLIVVPAGGSFQVAVALSADADLMRHSHDPSLNEDQADVPRHWMSEESGWLVLTPSSGEETEILVVPVYAALRAVSAMNAGEPFVDIGSGLTGSALLKLSGAGLLTGSNPPHDVVSLVSALELQAVVPYRPEIGAAGGPALVGVASDLEGHSGDISAAQVFFGVAAHETWSSPNEVSVEILIDRDGDGQEDFILSNGPVPGSYINDSFKSVLWNRALDQHVVQGWINGVSPAEHGTSMFDTNVLVLAVDVAGLAMTAGDTSFRYAARLSSRVEEESDAELGARRVGRPAQTDWLRYEVEAPGLDLSGGMQGPSIHRDLDDEYIPVDFDLLAFEEHGSLGILLLHHHNGEGARSEVVTLAGDRPDLSLSMSPVPDPVLIGESIRYDIEVGNVGSAPVADALVRCELPDEVEFDSAASDSACVEHSDVVECFFGELPAGEAGLKRVVVLVPESVGDGSLLVSSAVVETASIDPNPLNDAARAGVVARSVGSADLQVEISAHPVVVTPGETAAYTIVAKNLGPGDAAGSEVRDVFPEGVMDIVWTCSATQGSSCSAGPVSGDLEDLADLIVGGAVTYTAVGTIQSGVVGELDNTVTVNPRPAVVDGDQTNNSASAVITVSLDLLFTDGFESGDLSQWIVGP